LWELETGELLWRARGHDSVAMALKLTTRLSYPDRKTLDP
jgi:hypothetical protein